MVGHASRSSSSSSVDSSSTPPGRRSRTRTTPTGRTSRRSIRRCCSATRRTPGSGVRPAWLAAISPALLILPFPGGFRFTCYYYRGAYYKAFWADPIRLRGRRAAQEISRRALPAAHPPERPSLLPVLRARLPRHPRHDAWRAFWFADASGARHFGIGVGTLVLTVNVILLSGYTLGCHSLRHLVGGYLDRMAGRPVAPHRLRLRELPQPRPHALGVGEPLLGRLHRRLRAPLLHGHLARLADCSDA